MVILVFNWLYSFYFWLIIWFIWLNSYPSHIFLPRDVIRLPPLPRPTLARPYSLNIPRIDLTAGWERRSFSFLAASRIRSRPTVSPFSEEQYNIFSTNQYSSGSSPVPALPVSTVRYQAAKPVPDIPPFWTRSTIILFQSHHTEMWGQILYSDNLAACKAKVLRQVAQLPDIPRPAVRAENLLYLL